MLTNPARHPELFAPILCEHCPTEAMYLIRTQHPQHVCDNCLDVIADRHDWTGAAA